MILDMGLVQLCLKLFQMLGTHLFEVFPVVLGKRHGGLMVEKPLGYGFLIGRQPLVRGIVLFADSPEVSRRMRSLATKALDAQEALAGEADQGTNQGEVVISLVGEVVRGGGRNPIRRGGSRPRQASGRLTQPEQPNQRIERRHTACHPGEDQRIGLPIKCG